MVNSSSDSNDMDYEEDARSSGSDSYHLTNTLNEDDFIKKQKKAGQIAFYDSIPLGYKKIFDYYLDKGVDIAQEIDVEWEDDDLLDYVWFSWNALDQAIILSTVWPGFGNYTYFYQVLKEKSLELFSSYGLHSLHIASAVGDITEVKKYIEQCEIDKKIDDQSPFWPGMTPLLLAAKFCRPELVSELLDLGASPKVRDPKGSTALHYLAFYGHFDKKLFIYDDEDTFDKLTCMSHFLIACQFGSRTLDVVETYLKQGVSPNQQVKGLIPHQHRFDYFNGYSCLHLSGNTRIGLRKDSCPELTRLLLEYGANVNQLFDERNMESTPITSSIDDCYGRASSNMWAHVCVLIEAGATLSDKKTFDLIYIALNKQQVYGTYKESTTLMLLQCFTRMIKLLGKAATQILQCYYELLLEKVNVSFDKIAYTEVCQDELRELSKLGLRRILDDNAVVLRDFKQKFGSLVGSSRLPQIYPNYGHLLKIKLRNRLMEYEKKKQSVEEAIPMITFLVKNVCKLPLTCSEEILWNLNNKDLVEFIKNFSESIK